MQEIPPNAIQRLGPCLKGLLQAGCKQNENGAIFPSSWAPFLAELAKRSIDTYESPYCQQEYGLGGEISHHGDPSILHDGYLESGICCGLPRLRHRPRYACDNIQDDTEYMGGTSLHASMLLARLGREPEVSSPACVNTALHMVASSSRRRRAVTSLLLS